MNTITLPCQLLCASASAYAIIPTDRGGNYNPLDRLPAPVRALYQNQYDAVGFTGTPYVVTDLQIEAALIGKTNAGIIVAFRGTLPPALNWDSFFDWAQDFMADTQCAEHLPGKVHEGFLFAFNRLREGILQAIQTLDPSGSLPLYITGHSKGGGIAPIAAMYFRNANRLTITQTITFAGPNCGNGDFAIAYDDVFPNHIRYENYLDIVPILPPDAEFSYIFIAILESIPDIPVSFLNAVKDMASLNYEPVGNLEYIHSNGVAESYSKFDADILLPKRMAEIGLQLLEGNIAAIADAHHASCGYRYMQGTCVGTVCPA